MFGTKGMAMADNPRRSSYSVDYLQGSNSPPLHYSFPQRFEKAFELALAHFYSCLSGIHNTLINKTSVLLTKSIKKYYTRAISISMIRQRSIDVSLPH